jgi:hypothetical protein
MKVRANRKDARSSEHEKPTTGNLRYVGTDKHAAKVLEGKFFSNVAPKNAHKDRVRHDWVCSECGHQNRDYHVNCFNCNAKVRPF